MDKKVRNIAIFASGSGSNAENIYKYFQENSDVSVKYLVCNNPSAGVLKRFENTDVEQVLISKSDLSSKEFIGKLRDIDLIILAGFLLLIPKELVAAFSNKIINIHPALLPKYGGKGMYGDNVHKAILENREAEHGITIHFVNERYDEGAIIFQEKFAVEQYDDLQSIKFKIHRLEMEYFPKIIKGLLQEESL